MNENSSHQSGCCEKPTHESVGLQIAAAPAAESAVSDDVCCGSPPGPASRPFERPGYALLNFVEAFVQTPAGPVPRIQTDLRWQTLAGHAQGAAGNQTDAI